MLRTIPAFLLLGLAVSGLEACGGESAPADAPTIRVGYAGVLDFDDVPSAIAHERLRAEGLRVEVVVYSLTEQAAEALSRGDVDIANGALRTFWAARAKGADVVTVMEHVGNVHVLVGRAGKPGCQALEGRPVGIQSEAAGGTALLRTYLAEACPALPVETLAVARSNNRAAALLSGGLDAAVLEENQWLWLDATAPGRFAAVEQFKERWPDIRTSGVHVNRAFAARHPDVVRAYLRARLAANAQALAEPETVIVEATRVVGPSASWSRAAGAYLAKGMWSDTGGLTRESVAASVAFLQRNGQLSWAVAPDDLVDLSFLNSVRAQVSSHAP